MTTIRMRQERIARKWTQRYVAECIGITKAGYRNLEAGIRKPSYDTLMKLLDLFEYCDPRELFGSCERLVKKMRVVAIRDADEKEINIYGYGECVGNEPCPVLSGIPNPKIVLDDGSVVWGCECWWGPAEKFEKEMIAGRQINVVTKEAQEVPNDQPTG